MLTPYDDLWGLFIIWFAFVFVVFAVINRGYWDK